MKLGWRTFLNFLLKSTGFPLPPPSKLQKNNKNQRARK
jgi:hypothetical protein